MKWLLLVVVSVVSVVLLCWVSFRLFCLLCRKLFLVSGIGLLVVVLMFSIDMCMFCVRVWCVVVCVFVFVLLVISISELLLVLVWIISFMFCLIVCVVLLFLVGMVFGVSVLSSLFRLFVLEVSGVIMNVLLV